jgi:2-oxo-3-hexenedioate decarboxylase/2-keto-4-pentenoate hydratase
MAVTDDVRQAAADLLVDAAARRKPIPPLSSTFPGLGLDDAYAVQRLVVESRVEQGRRVRGHKVGLTSRAMQEMLGVDEPDYGVLLDDMFFADGDDVPAARFLQPRVEVEIAFLLRTGVPTPGATADDVLAATEAVAPSIEIIDSRIADWSITLADTIADNASSGAVVLGSWVPIGEAPDLREVHAELRKGGDVVADGFGRDVLDDPAAAVAWLANKLAELGVTLEAGHVVMPGSCTRAVDVAAGDRVEASFGALGSVRAEFT